MSTERARETETKRHFPDPSASDTVRRDVRHRRAEKSSASFERGTPHETCRPKKSGRPPARWRIRVVRVDPASHPEFQSQRTNPFAAMPAQARVTEIDAFCARLWARTKKKAA